VELITAAPPDAALLASNGRRFSLTDELTIGRADTAAIRLDDSAVSREHAMIRRHDDRWWIVDRGSRNGTRVNDTGLPALIEHPLRHGDRVTIGGHCLRVAMPASPDDDATTSLRIADLHALSPYQLQVVKALSEPWLRGEEPASNAAIAASLGTPQAEQAIKAALRRCYVKAGISQLATHTKRRELCRIASTNNWI
jgi:pSer/pThr/pTyr-binding forkhead associated (FHA) protein